VGRIFKCIPFVVFVLFTTAGFAQATQVSSLRFRSAQDHARLVFDVSSAVKHRLLMLSNPDRVVIDLANTRLHGRLNQPPSSHPLIKKIRSAPRNGTDLRVVLDLKSVVKPQIFALKPSGTHGHRLVVDLYDTKKTPAQRNKRQKTSDGKVVRNKKASGKNKIIGGTKTTRAALRKGVKTSSGAVKPKRVSRKTFRRGRDIVIAIDAGHGGDDPGARGVRGTKEKDVVFAIAKKLEALIRRQPGMRAMMIRNGDYYVSLRQRMRVARKARADLFVSIHADAYTKSHVHGSSVYTLSERGASSEAARWLAARENAADLVGGVSLDDKDDLLASVLLDLSQTATREASQDVAGKVLANLKRVGRLHKRQVQHAGFVVLKSPDIPSILVETAFISNPHEENNLRNKRHQTQLANAMFNGIVEYFAFRAPPGMHVAQEYVISPGDTLSAIAQRYGVSLKKLRVQNSLKGSEIRAGQVLKIPHGS
jgi:N-acetylmuramoyl-L-alanine amidase